MQKNGIVFLDFDGVTNTRLFEIKNDKLRGFFYTEEDMMVSNKNAIVLLNSLCLNYTYDIVVTSIWRKYHDQYPVDITLRNSGLDPRINVIGCTPILNKRHNEIKAWLLQNNYLLTDDYIILDDYPNMGDLTHRLIKCDFEIGFSYKEYQEAIKLIDSFQQKKVLIKK